MQIPPKLRQQIPNFQLYPVINSNLTGKPPIKIPNILDLTSPPARQEYGLLFITIFNVEIDDLRCFGIKFIQISK